MRSLSFPLVEMEDDLELEEIDSAQRTGKRDQEVGDSQHDDRKKFKTNDNSFDFKDVFRQLFCRVQF